MPTNGTSKVGVRPPHRTTQKKQNTRGNLKVAAALVVAFLCGVFLPLKATVFMTKAGSLQVSINDIPLSKEVAATDDADDVTNATQVPRRHKVLPQALTPSQRQRLQQKRLQQHLADNERLVASEMVRIPSAPDETAIRDLKRAFKTDEIYEEFMQNATCVPTAQFELHIQTIEDTESKRTTVRYVIQSLDEKGTLKMMGGDEFFPVFYDARRTEMNPMYGRVIPSATAHVHDNNDGTYVLRFEEPPFEKPIGELYGHGSFVLYYEYTCGIGRLTRPAKDDWNDGGYMYTNYTTLNLTTPEIQPFEYPPEVQDSENRVGATVDFSSYDRVICFGDSVLDNFCGRYYGRKNFFEYPNLKVDENIGSIFRYDIWREKVPEVLNRTHAEDLELANDPTKKVAMILNSAAWDINGYEGPAQDTNFTASMRMFREAIEFYREAYPKVTLLWKLPQPFHMSVLPRAHCKPDCMARVKYTSISTARFLHDEQNRLMEELNVPVLNVWNAAYLSFHWHMPNDATHWHKWQNGFFIDMYYFDPAKKQTVPRP